MFNAFIFRLRIYVFPNLHRFKAFGTPMHSCVRAAVRIPFVEFQVLVEDLDSAFLLALYKAAISGTANFGALKWLCVRFFSRRFSSTLSTFFHFGQPPGDLLSTPGTHHQNGGLCFLFNELSCYIHRNPLRAGIIARLAEYPWSSCKAYTYGGKALEWLLTKPILDQFDSKNRHKAYIYRHYLSSSIEIPLYRFINNRRISVFSVVFP